MTASAEESLLFLFMLVSVNPKPFDARSPQFRLFCTREEAAHSLKVTLREWVVPGVGGCNTRSDGFTLLAVHRP